MEPGEDFRPSARSLRRFPRNRNSTIQNGLQNLQLLRQFRPQRQLRRSLPRGHAPFPRTPRKTGRKYFTGVKVKRCKLPPPCRIYKGCVVLNQFLHEFHSLRESDFISRIEGMFWLDGGHGGGKDTWITAKPVLEAVAKLGIKISIHVSPYQIRDDRRPWIRKEERVFFNTLSLLKAPLHRVVYFEDEPPSIYQHFHVLNEFCKCENTA